VAGAEAGIYIIGCAHGRALKYRKPALAGNAFCCFSLYLSWCIATSVQTSSNVNARSRLVFHVGDGKRPNLANPV
jgi:hypothetical protein